MKLTYQERGRKGGLARAAKHPGINHRVVKELLDLGYRPKEVARRFHVSCARIFQIVAQEGWKYEWQYKTEFNYKRKPKQEVPQSVDWEMVSSEGVPLPPVITPEGETYFEALAASTHDEIDL